MNDKEKTNIINLLERERVAIFYKKIDSLKELILDEAIIVDIFGNYINKKQFIDLLSKADRVKRLVYLNIIVKFDSCNKAEVSFVRNILFNNFEEVFKDSMYVFEKYDDSWKIVRSEPVTNCYISYMQNRSLENEKEIIKFLDLLIKANAKKDFAYLDSVISNEVIIIDSNNGLKNKNEYFKWKESVQFLKHLKYLNVRFFSIDNNKVRVFYVRQMTFYNLKEVFDNKYYDLVLECGSWKIVKSGYTDFL